MFVLGIDPGLSVTGYGIVAVEGPAMKAVAAGVIRTAVDSPIGDRLRELADDLGEVLEEHHPDVAAIEEVFVNRNLQTATSVGRAAGVAILTVARAGIPLTEYSPSAVKLAVTGSGTADKGQVTAMVTRRLGLAGPPRPVDAADALAVAMCRAQGGRLAAAGRRR